MRTFKVYLSISFGLALTLLVLWSMSQFGLAQAASLRIDFDHNSGDVGVVYVDADAAGAGTGVSWTDAYTNLQDALSTAISGTQIWVAEGVYYPDEGAGQINDAITSTFVLTDGAAIYGGFDPGNGADEFGERDWNAHITILSGDLDHNDITDSNNVVTAAGQITGTNAYHVVTSLGVTNTAVLDGFFITAGQAKGDLVLPCGPACGGGMYNLSGSPTLLNLHFSGNDADIGGGIANLNGSNPTLLNVVFSGNLADQGGGMYNYASRPSLTSVVFSENQVVTGGGGMYNNQNSSPTLNQVSFIDNLATIDHGGGMSNDSGSNPKLIYVSFSGNTAGTKGGGIYSSESIPSLTNVIFLGNSAGWYGGGMHNQFGSDASLVNVVFSGNSTGWFGGGIFNQESDPTLTHVSFSGNQSNYYGGGVYNFSNSNPSILNSVLSGNTAAQAGTEQVYNVSGSAPVISNTLIQDSGGSGSGWDTALGIDGGGNLDADPKFVRNPDPGLDGNWDGVDDDYGDLRLLPASPAINTGSATDCPTRDLEDHLRPYGLSCDMGAYELIYSPVYVDVDALGAATGVSWTDAYTNLQDALSTAISGTQIWVAAGVYYPDEGVGQINDAISTTFVLTDGVEIYGGFDPGSGVDEFSERAWDTYVTVLSGDIDRNDIADSNGVVTDTDNIFGANAYHVFSSLHVTRTAVLDGFTITAGHTNAEWDSPCRLACGGGVINASSSSPSLVNLILSGNEALGGGGMFNGAGSSPWLENVVFSNNAAELGGGMLNSGFSHPALTDVVFSMNSASLDGGGMRNQDHSSPILEEVTFSNNAAGRAGGGVHNQEDSNPSLRYVVFSNNLADSGGGLFNGNASNPGLFEVDFVDNTAASDGGGMANYESSPSLTDVLFSGNSANLGGGAYNTTQSNPLVTNTIFVGNSAHYGGGLANNAGSAPVFVNVLLVGNFAEIGGGLNNDHSSPSLINVTLSGNQAESDGGGIYNENQSAVSLTNVILWGNVSTQTETSQIFNTVNSTTTIRYSLVQNSGGSGVSWHESLGVDGGHNLDANPLFVRDPDPGADGSWDGFDDDYGNQHLQFGSTAINAGTNIGCPSMDLDKRSRPFGTFCDLGVYETAFDFTKLVDDDTPEPGQTITFTIVVENNFDDQVGGVISDSLPVGLNFVGAVFLEPPDSGWVGSSPPFLASNLMISTSEKITLTFPVTVSYGFAAGTQIVNTAGFSSTTMITPVLSAAVLTIQNLPPIADDNQGAGFVTSEDDPFTTTNVLVNDFDPNGDSLTVVNINRVGSQGLIANNEDGTFYFDPNGQFEFLSLGEQTMDTFTYTVGDGHGGMDTAVVTITVQGINDPPFAQNDSDAGFITNEDSSFTTASVLLNDSDPEDDLLTIVSVDLSSTQGLVSDLGDGSFVYNPDGQFEYLSSDEQATDTFSYTLDDGHGAEDTAVVTIVIQGVNDPPIASNDSGPGFTTDEDTPFITPSVLTNDSDPEDDDLVILFMDTQGTLGQVTDRGDGTFEYDPDGQFEYLKAGEQATDVFTYTINDNFGGVDSAVVTLTIQGVNDNPVAENDAGIGFATDEDTLFRTGNVLSNDSDLESDALTVISIDTTGTLGQVTDLGDGTFEYDPDGKFEDLEVGEQAVDTFTYTLGDGHGGTDTATVTIVIGGVWDGFRIFIPLILIK